MVTSFVKTSVPGLFFSRPKPDAAPFLKEGDLIAAGDAVGVVEVMKSFATVTSDSAGRFVRYLVEDDEDVMPGDAVCEIES